MQTDHGVMRVLRAVSAQPGKYRILKTALGQQLLEIHENGEEEEDAPVKPLQPIPDTSGPFFEQCQVEIASNTGKLPPAKEKAANEKAKMVRLLDPPYIWLILHAYKVTSRRFLQGPSLCV